MGTIGEKPPHVFIFAQQLAADCLLLSLLEGVSQKGGTSRSYILCRVDDSNLQTRRSVLVPNIRTSEVKRSPREMGSEKSGKVEKRKAGSLVPFFSLPFFFPFSEGLRLEGSVLGGNGGGGLRMKEETERRERKAPLSLDRTNVLAYHQPR